MADRIDHVKEEIQDYSEIVLPQGVEKMNFLGILLEEFKTQEEPSELALQTLEEAIQNLAGKDADTMESREENAPSPKQYVGLSGDSKLVAKHDRVSEMS